MQKINEIDGIRVKLGFAAGTYSNFDISATYSHINPKKNYDFIEGELHLKYCFEITTEDVQKTLDPAKFQDHLKECNVELNFQYSVI